MLPINREKNPRLYLPLPAGATWRMHYPGPNLHEAEIDENVRLRVRALVAPSFEHTEWITSIMLEDTPPGARLEQVSLESMVSPRGWPLVFAHHVVRGPDGAVFEERAGAFFAIIHVRAEAIVRLRGGTRWTDREAELKPYILTAHIDWPDYEDDLVITQLGIQL